MKIEWQAASCSLAIGIEQVHDFNTEHREIFSLSLSIKQANRRTDGRAVGRASERTDSRKKV